MDFSIVSTIAEFVFMVGIVHHAYTEKMLKNSKEVAVVVHVLNGICCHSLVSVVWFIWENEKLYVIVLVLKKIVMIVWQQRSVLHVLFVKKHVNLNFVHLLLKVYVYIKILYTSKYLFHSFNTSCITTNDYTCVDSIWIITNDETIERSSFLLFSNHFIFS